MVRPWDIRTGTSRTTLLRDTSGNVLEEDSSRFGFFVHFCPFSKATLGVRTLKAHLCCPMMCPSQKWRFPRPAFTVVYSQVHCENLVVEQAQSGLWAGRCQDASAGLISSPRRGGGGWRVEQPGGEGGLSQGLKWT